jgi:uncharacterized protein
MKLIFRYLYILCLLLSVQAVAQVIPPRPNPPRLVNDFANVLSASEKENLERKLVQFDDSTGSQVAVVIVKSLEGYTVEETAHGILRNWSVGQKGKNNGVVILAALEDRKINIQTGYGMEGVLPDLVCKRIITKHIIPAFKQQRYYEGLDAATTSIIEISKNEYKADDLGQSAGGDIWIFAIMIFIFLIFIMISMRRQRQRGTIMTRRGYTDWDGGGWWYLPGGGGGYNDWGDDNNRGGGGWDFGGFDGGDGGGGGASGDW